MRDDFAIFIMSYNRPENVASLGSLKKSGYTGRWYIIIGDDDPKVAEYKATYGEKVVVFSKQEYVQKTDRMGLDITKVICFARNACFDIAESVGVKFFQQFDDDYSGYYIAYDENMQYVNTRHRVKSYDTTAENLISFFEGMPDKCLAVSFSQGGDFIGGHSENNWGLSKVRKCMNSWLCATDRRFSFSGCMNEDVSAYTSLQAKGYFFINIMQYRLQQPVTQSSSGGMSAIYKQYGTHAKSFLTVIQNPSFTKIAVITNNHQRLHHRIDWRQCASKIVRQTNKKDA